MKNLFFVLSFFILTGLLSAQQTTGSQSMFSASYNYEKNGDYKNAISSILKVYDKDNYFINLRLGWLYYLSADYNSSKKYYESAKNICGSCSDAQLGLTLPLSMQNNWSEIVNIYKQILKKDSQNYSANLKLGQYYFNNRDYANAKIHFDKIATSLPADYENTLYLAWTFYYLGDFTEAKENFLVIEMLSPNDPSALEGLNLIK